MKPEEQQEAWKDAHLKNQEAWRLFIDGICETGVGPFGMESNAEFHRSMAAETHPDDLPYIREYKLYAGTVIEARQNGTPYPILKTERWRNWMRIPQMFSWMAAKFVAGEKAADAKMLKDPRPLLRIVTE